MDDDLLSLIGRAAEAIIALERDVQRLDAQRLALQTICGYLLAGVPQAHEAVSRAASGIDDLTLAMSLTEEQRGEVAAIFEQILSALRLLAERQRQRDQDQGEHP